MREIVEGVYFIQGQDELIPDSHVYLIGDRGSGDFSIVDAGLMGKGGYKLGAIEGLGISLKDVKRVIMTHTHLDHIGCFPEIREQIPGVELWIHEVEARALERGDERILYGMDMFRTMCEQQFGLRPGDFSFKVDRHLGDGESVQLGNMVWKIFHVPGHSPGSIALYNTDNKILIPGDVVYADYAIGRFDLHGANGHQLKNSLMRLAELDVEVLLPGHNSIVEKVPPGYILDTARQWAPYLV
ncbi:MAG: MBL fold metallo-hydrolase [Deltaproteobacteria bacterium]|nr:MBL fold metallo-hydrolase [Deltaproteobacteria bacterium]MBW1935703.1 MBL fold metallo-hydrolase [Deltaproteobacteria bacterium]MBW1978419.1 MBL fold metallo-hydrolase [Deltaproteobacteria bacterium]MBW2045412.1 MBL fold metallo-hydrolase [Deltaproteobacteria bacterium]MBW2299206.1 MBL fold metallo-hydrolase [Deltaproteobacteria bacterium]